MTAARWYKVYNERLKTGCCDRCARAYANTATGYIDEWNTDHCTG